MVTYVSNIVFSIYRLAASLSIRCAGVSFRISLSRPRFSCIPLDFSLSVETFIPSLFVADTLASSSTTLLFGNTLEPGCSELSGSCVPSESLCAGNLPLPPLRTTSEWGSVSVSGLSSSSFLLFSIGTGVFCDSYIKFCTTWFQYTRCLKIMQKKHAAFSCATFMHVNDTEVRHCTSLLLYKYVNVTSHIKGYVSCRTNILRR